MPFTCFFDVSGIVGPGGGVRHEVGGTILAEAGEGGVDGVFSKKAIDGLGGSVAQMSAGEESDGLVAFAAPAEQGRSGEREKCRDPKKTDRGAERIQRPFLARNTARSSTRHE
jgi:hypothetical protein